MTKQQQIDALTADNVRMSALLQQMANKLPQMALIMKDEGFPIAGAMMTRWLEEMKMMDIEPALKVES